MANKKKELDWTIIVASLAFIVAALIWYKVLPQTSGNFDLLSSLEGSVGILGAILLFTRVDINNLEKDTFVVLSGIMGIIVAAASFGVGGASILTWGMPLLGFLGVALLYLKGKS